MHKMRITVLLAAIVAVFAVSVAPAMAAKNFVAKASIGQIKGKTVGKQVFKAAGLTVECTVANASGKITQLKTTEQELEFKYPNASCKVGGLAEVKISQEKYVFHANGEVHLNNEVKIEAIGCKLIVGAGQTFTGEQVKYENKGNNLNGEAKVTGIKYVGTGASCNETNSNGIYEGTEELEGNKPPTAVGVE